MSGLEPLIIGGVVASAAGGMVKAAGAKKQAEAEAEANEYNAEVAERNIKLVKDAQQAELKQSKIAARDLARDNKRVRQSMKASYGASGFEYGGSQLDVLADAAREQKLDEQRVRYEGKVQYRNRAIEILGLKDDAKLSRMGAKNSRTAGNYNAAGAVLSGVGGAMTRMA